MTIDIKTKILIHRDFDEKNIYVNDDYQLHICNRNNITC